MSIKTDAYAILRFIVEKKNTNNSEISQYFEFDRDRVLDALKYLEEKGLINVEAKSLGGQWHMIGPSAYGIDYIDKLDQEEKEKQKKIFKLSKIEEPKEEPLDQISKIEKKLNFLLSRKYRETTYKSIFYPLIITSFITILVTSTIELAKFLIPDKFKSFLYLTFYFLVLISLLIVVFLFDRIRENLEVDDFILLFKIKEDTDLVDLSSKLRKILEKSDHQFSRFDPLFYGFPFFHRFRFWVNSRGSHIDNKESILKDNFIKFTKKLIYEFKYINSRNIFSSLEIDFKESKVRLNMDRGTDKVSHKIFKDIMSFKELEFISKSGWDYE